MSRLPSHGFRPKFETIETRDQPSVLASGDLLASTDEPAAGGHEKELWVESFSWGSSSPSASGVLVEWFAKTTSRDG